MTEDFRSDTPTLQEYVAVLKRRARVLVALALGVPLALLLVSLSQPKLYSASADVLLARQNLGATVTGVSDSSATNRSDTFPITQASLAAVPLVARRALDAIGLTGRSASDLLAHSSVKPKADTDLLVFSVTDGDPTMAARLATAYARQFTIYRKQLDTAAIHRAEVGVEAQIGQLMKTKQANAGLLADLLSKRQQLRTLEALQTGNTFLVKQADVARRVQPRPLRSAALGLGLGLILGALAAFLREALDTRVRAAAEITTRLGRPVIGRIPSPTRRRRDGNRSVALIAEPSGAQAQSYRVLRTNIEFLNLERAARLLMVTSAVPGEGKSTTAANLAVAFARAGRRTVLVDLDFAAPSLHTFFGLEQAPGLTDVALGHADLDAAVARVAVGAGPPPSRGNGNGSGNVDGVLEVLPSGPPPPIPAEFVATHALAEILDELRARADLILVDAPALLAGSETLTLAPHVDGLVVVLRLNRVRRSELADLRVLLDGCRASTLGIVVSAADADAAKSSGSREQSMVRRALQTAARESPLAETVARWRA